MNNKKENKPKQDKKPRKKRQTGKGNVTAIDDWRNVIENMYTFCCIIKIQYILFLLERRGEYDRINK